MIEVDGYASESDASAYSGATYGYDADDASADGDISGNKGTDLTVNSAASRQQHPPTGGILRKKKVLRHLHSTTMERDI
jgi:hypothetical protein